MQYYIFFVTVSGMEEAKKIAQILVEEKLVACVNIIKSILSTYRWKNKVEINEEQLLVIKTTEKNADALIEKVNEIHSYDVPECIGFAIDKGSDKYLNWIAETTI